MDANYWKHAQDMNAQEFAAMRTGMWAGCNYDGCSEDELRDFIAGDVAAILRNDGTPHSPPVPGGVGLKEIRAAIGALQLVADEIEYRQAKAVIEKHRGNPHFAGRLGSDFDNEVTAEIEQAVDRLDPKKYGTVIGACANDGSKVAAQIIDRELDKVRVALKSMMLSRLPPDAFSSVIRHANRAVEKAGSDPHAEGRDEVLAALKSVTAAYGDAHAKGQDAALDILKKHTPNGQAKLSALQPDKFAAVRRACKRAVAKVQLADAQEDFA